MYVHRFRFMTLYTSQLFCPSQTSQHESLLKLELQSTMNINYPYTFENPDWDLGILYTFFLIYLVYTIDYKFNVQSWWFR